MPLVESSLELRASKTLVETAHAHPRVAVHTDTEVVAFKPDARGHLGAVLLRHRPTGTTKQFRPGAVFVYAAARPNTDFPAGLVDRDHLGSSPPTRPSRRQSPGCSPPVMFVPAASSGAASRWAREPAALFMARQYLTRMGDVSAAAWSAPPRPAQTSLPQVPSG